MSVLVVSFISLCFFKKRFWENRYLVLLISGCVALVVTLTTNYATRGNLDKKVGTIWEKPMNLLSINDSLLINDFNLTVDKELELTFNDHLTSKDDTIVMKRYGSYVLYYGSDNSLKIGYAWGDKLKYEYVKNVYISPSQSDTVAYFTKLKQNYNPEPNYWMAGFSLPRVQTVKCFYIPPKEYAALPDSLIRKLPL